MRTIMMMVVVLSTSIVSAAWLQVGTGRGPAKVTVVEANALGATVTVEVPGIETESVAVNGAQYVKLAIPGAVSAGLDVGKPEVPAVPVLLARPTGSTVALRILSIQTETLHVARVFPKQPALKLGEQSGLPVVDVSSYASDAEYPSSRLSSPRTATWRDLDVVNVHVYPVSVRPARQEVIVTSRITFRADFSGGQYPARVAGWMEPMYRSLIQNYDDLGLSTLAQEPPGTKCLVFCDKDYYNYDYRNPALVSLLDTMTKLGDSCEIFSVDHGVSPGAIKSTIIERYNDQNEALHWVLLVGECDEIPPKRDYVKPEWGLAVPYSDYWYSDWGLSDDTVVCDDYPEVGIARLSPSDTQDLSNQIAKIEDYMMGADAGTWLTRTTLVAHRDQSPTVSVERADTVRLLFYPDVRRDTLMGIRGFSNMDVKIRAEQGTGVLIYLGSGRPDGTGWMYWDSLDEDWNNGNVLDLKNSHSPVVFNLACHCGDLSKGTCLSEQWMRKHPDPEVAGKGAVASFGCTGLACVEPADSQCIVAVRATGDYWMVKQGQYGSAPVFDLGGIQMFMDAYVATLWEGCDEASNIYSFMWLGNPAMPVWSGGTPARAYVSYPSHILPGSETLHIMVKTQSDGYPIENARVCMYKPGDFYAVGLTDGSGDVCLTFAAQDTGSFFVSASEGHVKLSNPIWQPHTPMLPYFGTSVVSGVAEGTHNVPRQWSLSVSPNPARNAISVRYDVPGPSRVSVGVYDANGRLVRSLYDGEVEAGPYETRLQPGVLPAGIYFVRLDAPDFRSIQKAVVTR